MTGNLLPTLNAILGLLILVLASNSSALPQSQALDGQIEGSITDQNGAAVAAAKVTVVNVGVGLTRTSHTDTTGIYRIPLLPLGTYRLVAEAASYKTEIREGLALSTGQIRTMDLVLMPGEPQESVTVAANNPIADTGKTDLGRVLSEKETGNLPLVSRNPWGFVMLQPNVSGRPPRGGNFPNITANGYLRRVNYQLDGSTATQADRAGVRLIQVSEAFVKEVQLVSNGFAAEFGNTPGVVMNLVTPSGTNSIDGSVSYLFRLPSFYSRPFGYRSPSELEDNFVSDVVGRAGMPLVHDRWHLFGGFEQIIRRDGSIPNRLVTITDTNKAQLIAAGISASIFPAAILEKENTKFAIVRADVQLNDVHRLAARFNMSDFLGENFIAGGINTLEKSVNTTAVDHTAGAQLVSYARGLVNEFRFQYVRRKVADHSNELSGIGPTITISNVANFGAPESVGGISPLEKQMQFLNNVTLIRGTHVTKVGVSLTRINDLSRANVFARYVFPSIEAYTSARDDMDPRSYTRYEESSGDPESRYQSTYWNAFAQDDWKLSPQLKLTFGVRYDLYRIPDADANSVLASSREFKVDRDNFAPRLAAVYAVRSGERPTILRLGAGMYYEAPWLNMYERALRRNGRPTYFNYSVTPASPTAPAFPETFPQGLTLPIQDIETVAPDIENLYAVHAHAQFEQAMTSGMSVIAQFIHSSGRQIPVYRSINYIRVGLLPDGRPVFSRLVSAETRFDPRFNNILIVESAGRSRYDALSFQFIGRMQSLHFTASYTLSRARDDAPEQNVSVGEVGNAVLSNTYDRSFDLGRSYSDQRHSFVSSVVAKPELNLSNRVLRGLMNNNQVGVIARVNSGQAFSVFSDIDLNNDGLNQDRPLGYSRNSETTPPLFNLDLRYSRFVPLGRSVRLEVFAEFTNLLNVSGIFQFNNVSIPTDSNGLTIGEFPDLRARNQTTFQESRQTQVGAKVYF